MSRLTILAAALLIFAAAAFVGAQTEVIPQTQTTTTTVTKTVQNPDGTYTVIEYPVGKEVQLTFTPVGLTKTKTVGTIIRDDTGTRIVLNMTDVPAEISAMNVYAIDDTGVVTSLGPVVLANGTGKFSVTTPLSFAGRYADGLRRKHENLFPQRGTARLCCNSTHDVASG
jgi:hypothetical protein